MAARMRPGTSRVARVVTTAAAVLALGACGTPVPQVTASPLPEAVTTTSPSPSPTPSPSPDASPSPASTPTGRFPLTGESSDRPRTAEPVLAVKVDNATAAFPQAGLELADIVYEELVEGGATRLLALFHSQIPEVVGPVRSARLVDADLLAPHHPVLAYSGARIEVSRALRDTGAIGLVVDRGGGSTFDRDEDRFPPHDLMADTDAVLGRGADLDGVEAASSGLEHGPADAEGEVGVEVSIRMSRSQVTSWEYDVEEGVYRRFSNGSPFLVTGTGRVGAANVVVVLTDVGEGGCCDSAGQPYVETRLTGSGDAVVLRDGRRLEATWAKASAADHLVLRFADGEPVHLAPGATWIHLAPDGAVG